MKNRIVKIIVAFIIVFLLHNVHFCTFAQIPEVRPIGHIFVEFNYGFCYGSDGSGQILGNNVCPCHNYIHYCNAKQGEAFVSVFVYNPLSIWCDDIIFRYDIKAPMTKEATDTFEFDYNTGKEL